MSGMLTVAWSTSNWLASSARTRCCSLEAGSRETSRTRGRRSATASSKRVSPKPAAEILPARAMAPDEFTEACKRR